MIIRDAVNTSLYALRQYPCCLSPNNQSLTTFASDYADKNKKGKYKRLWKRCNLYQIRQYSGFSTTKILTTSSLPNSIETMEMDFPKSSKLENDWASSPSAGPVLFIQVAIAEKAVLMSIWSATRSTSRKINDRMYKEKKPNTDCKTDSGSASPLRSRIKNLPFG